MRATALFMPTVKEDPADAEAVSHKLMVRGGFVRQFASGIYIYLPLGWRVMGRVWSRRQSVGPSGSADHSTATRASPSGARPLSASKSATITGLRTLANTQVSLGGSLHPTRCRCHAL